MAEIFGAVASGAGLLSLAIQLLESSQRLKGFYNASRDAPQAVADLSYELHTMSLSLRQLESHRRGDILGDELLSRCILTCANMIKKIETALGKMERLLHKSRKMGGMYTAFKEPEIRKLLEDLEQAKSSMLFAYMSYCQSYNIHEASSRAATVLAQNALLSSHEMHLQNLDRTIRSGHAAILSHVRSSEPQATETSLAVSSSSAHVRVQSQQMLPVRWSRPKHRLALPRWFADTVWEFGVYDSEGGWIFQLRPINIRPYGMFVFDVVRSGNVRAVQALLASGELSLSDYEDDVDYLGHRALPQVAAAAGRLGLCDFLLQQFSGYRCDAILREGLKSYFRNMYMTGHKRVNQSTEAFYQLFVGKYGLQIDLQDPTKDCSGSIEFQVEVESGMLLTEKALREVIASQPIPFKTWPFAERFSAAMNSIGWSAETFVELVCPVDLAQLAQYQDSRGKTALHWAAEHLGYQKHRGRFNDALKHFGDSYAELAAKLITIGADLHALDSTNETPFSRMLQGRSWKESRDRMPWIDNSLADVVQCWGHLVVNSGCSLETYVVRENLLLGRPNDHACKLRVYGIFKIKTYRLSFSETSDLVLEVESSLGSQLWEFHRPPGAWESTAYQIDRIHWAPTAHFEGDDYYLWRTTDYLEGQPKTTLIGQRPRVGQVPRLLAADVFSAWYGLITSAQDDHGFIATKSSRTTRAYLGHKRRRRAASLPPPRTVEDHASYGQIDNEGLWARGTGARGRWPQWILRARKCAFDLKWKWSFMNSGCKSGYHFSLRECMLGRCNDWEPGLLGTDYWEVELLDDQDNVEIASQLIDRFRPEWRGILDDNQEVTRRRAELGMTSSTGPDTV